MQAIADSALESGETKDLSTILAENDQDSFFLPRNAKLTDPDIVLMRELRHDYALEWELLGEMFKVNPKTCYRICLGMSRPKCEGPIEELEHPQPMLETVRCKTCGGKHDKASLCQLCQCRWAIHITRFLSKTGFIRVKGF